MNTDAATTFQLRHTPGVGVIMFCTRRHSGAQYTPPAVIRTALDVIAYAEQHEAQFHTPQADPRMMPFNVGPYLSVVRSSAQADEYLASWARHPANAARCEGCSHPVGAHKPGEGCSIVPCSCTHPTGVK